MKTKREGRYEGEGVEMVTMFENPWMGGSMLWYGMAVRKFTMVVRLR